MKHLRACFIFYILLFVTVSRAQKESIADIKGINTQHEISNLKGHVKEIKSVTITNNEDQEVVQNKFYYNKDVGGPGYILYESGLLCKSYLAPAVFDKENNVYNLLSNNKAIDSLKTTKGNDLFSKKYEYDSLDLVKKSKYHPKYSFMEVLGEFDVKFDIYKLNVNKYTINRSEKNLHINIYRYDFDKKGRITKLKEYDETFIDCINYRDTLMNFNKSPEKYISDKEDLKYFWDYQYDDLDRIIRLAVSFIHVDNKRDEGGNIINKKIYEFKYNGQNKVIELRVLDTGLKDPKEELTKTYQYEYHPTDGYLLYKEEILDPKYFYTRNDGGNSEYTDIHSKFQYDAYGNIIEREFLSEMSKEVNKKKDPYEEWWRNPYAPRYYEYEYDKYNNWTKCTAYLRGVKTPKPSLVVEREITYYEDSK